MNLPPWTVTFLQDDENCPRKAWHRYVAKDLPKEPPTPEQLHGRNVHKLFEDRLLAKTPFPAEHAHYERWAAPIENAPGEKLVEQKLAVKPDASPCSFFDDDVWGRGVLDSVIILGSAAVLFDWKTGSSKYEDPFELQAHALLLKAKYPGLTSVTGRYVWLKEQRVGKPYDLSNFAYTYNDLKTRTKLIEQRPLEQEWPANPNPLCGWCPVKTCAHNRSK